MTVETKSAAEAVCVVLGIMGPLWLLLYALMSIGSGRWVDSPGWSQYRVLKAAGVQSLFVLLLWLICFMTFLGHESSGLMAWVLHSTWIPKANLAVVTLAATIKCIGIFRECLKRPRQI